jgi:D-3-phosphoglycerate dehydrogenase
VAATTKVVYIGAPGISPEWFEDIQAAIHESCTISRYDPEKPVAEQFDDVAVVVDVGLGDRRVLIDAAVAAGVKLWHVTTTGLDRVDVAYFLERGMPLANMPGASTAVPVAEHALFLMLCFAKNVVASQRNIARGIFYEPLNREVYGKTVVIVGLGAIGRELAKRCAALGMAVIGVDVIEMSDAERCAFDVALIRRPEDLHKVLPMADYVSLHVPLTNQTRDMISAREFRLMKRSAVLINVARGPVVNEDALIEALRARQIRGAGLDVFVSEPLDADHPLCQLENAVLTPHIAGVTRETSVRRAQAVAENVARVTTGLPPLWQVTAVP